MWHTVSGGLWVAGVLLWAGCSSGNDGTTANDKVPVSQPVVNDSSPPNRPAREATNSPVPPREAAAVEAAPQQVSPVVIQAATPLHLAEIIQRIDLRTLPFMEGNSRNSATVANYGFTMPSSSKKTVADVMEYLDQIVSERGCEQFPSLEFNTENPNYASRLYQHGDLVLSVNCGATKGFDGPEINASLVVAGNFDVRAVPVPPDSNRLRASPVSAQLESSLEIMELRKFHTEAMSKLGWLAYRDLIPGVEISVEDQLPHQYFIRNGVALSLYYRKADATEQPTKTHVSLSASVVLFEPVFPPDARSIEIRFEPATIVFETALKPEEVGAFLAESLQKQGYKSPGDDPPPVDGLHVFRYVHPDSGKLEAECKALGKSTLVVINQQ